jgi:hypothetical protein
MGNASQRQVLTAQAGRLASAADNATGYDRALLLWRLHSTKAVIEFTDAMLSDPTTTAGNATDNFLSVNE